MKNYFVFGVIILSNLAQERPKLVVGIVVDQMKMEYLYRFRMIFPLTDLKG
jgi:hypothetical protein